MSNPEQTVIRAIIPCAKDPTKLLRAPGGEFPAHIHERGSGTYEEGLRALGREVIGCVNLSVNRRVRLDELEETAGEIVYATKPLENFMPKPDDLFQWR